MNYGVYSVGSLARFGGFSNTGINDRKQDFSKVTWNSTIRGTTFTVSHDILTTSKEVLNVFEVSVRIADLHKEVPYIPAGYLKALIDELVKTFKSKAGYRSSSVYLSTVDFYDSDIDMYDVPRFTHEKGQRVPREGVSNHGSIPKGWKYEGSVFFEGEMSIRMRNSLMKSLLALVGLEYTKEFQKEVKVSLEKKDERRFASSTRNLFCYDTYDLE